MNSTIIINNSINLDNNYYLKITNTNTEIPCNIINIENLKINKIIKYKNILLKIDFDKIKEAQYKKILRKLLFIKKVISKTKLSIGIQEDSKKLLGYLLNYDENNKRQHEFILGINSIFYRTKRERYNYIYDTACDYLDGFFYGKNLCDFKDNKCGEKRNTTSTTGCCHHYRIKCLGPLTKLVLCEHLKADYTCGAKCIGCKLFTCDYLRKKGIKFRIRDILLLDTFFNPIQKYFIRYKVFTPKEKIIKILLFWS